MGLTIEQQYEAQKPFIKQLLSRKKGEGYQLETPIKVKFHALYRQIEIGDCDTKRPLMPGLEKDIWNSWNRIKGAEKIELMKEYVNEAVIVEFANQDFESEN